MKIIEYISYLRKEKNILITVNDNDIKIRGDKDALTKEIIAEIKTRKEEILAYFQSLNEYEQEKNISIAEEKELYTLSSAQKRLYFIQEFEKESIAYNQPIIVKLEGELDKESFQRTFNQLVARHAALRTSFVNVNGAVFQKINTLESVNIQYINATPEDVDDKISQFISPFDLSDKSQFRVGVLVLSDKEYILMVDMHHIISDGVSHGILMKEFMDIYHNKELPELKLQYKDYAEWQANEEQETKQKKKEFWLSQFSEETIPLNLVTDFSRPKRRSYKGDVVEFNVDATTTKQLRSLAEAEGTTLYTVFLSVFYVLLHKLTNQEDIVIGTPISGRDHADLETIIGTFVNTLALRNYPKATTSFENFLSEVKTTTLSCFDNQSYQYEELINDLKVARDTSRNALFDVMFTYQNYEVPTLEFSDLVLKHHKNVHSDSIFDLHLIAFEVEDHMEFNFTFQTELYKKETITRFVSYFKQALLSIIENPKSELSDITVLPLKEREQILETFNHATINYPHKETLASLFENQVEKTPENIALRFKEETFSYKELELRSEKLAIYLQQLGVNTNTLVGICMDRSIEMIIAILGVVRAGGTYVPIDPDYPKERIQHMVRDAVIDGNLSPVHIVLTQDTVKESLQDIITDEVAMYSLTNAWNDNGMLFNIQGNLESTVVSDDTAYIIYTSGSTGKPKGVKVAHRNVVSLLKNKATHFDFNEKDIWTMFHSYCFDFSVWEMYGALLFGGELIIVPKEVTKEPKLFAELIHDNKVTVLNQTPMSFYMLQESYALQYNETAVRYVIFGGEALHPSKLRTWYTSFPEVTLVNMYGITETTVHVTYKEIRADEINSGISNIGTSLPTLQCYILDQSHKIVPIGVPGELYVSGAGVTKGYLNRDELTDERFLKNPFASQEHEKLYRTGDLVRWLPDGNMEYMGRIDTQVKIRGFRIELGEIEAVLNGHSAVKKSVVIAKDHVGTKQLIGYYVSDGVVTVDELRKELSKSLPDYMVPTFMVSIDAIPMTSNGKVDRKKLTAKELEVNSISDYKAPVTEIERLMVDVWKEALSVVKIGVNDNFFALGGDSIKAIKLIYKINEMLNCNLHVADMYAYQTIEELSGIISEKTGSSIDERAKAEEEIEMFQEWYKNEVGMDDSYEAVYPMSGIEKGMTFYTLMKDDDEDSFHNIIYHEQNLYSIPIKDFKYDVFERAIELLMEKHSTLRKVYDVERFAHIIKKKMKPELFFVDISHMTHEEQQNFGLENKDKERVKSTDFSGEVPLWRMSIIKVREDYHYLLFDMHHSVLDGWSLYSFLTELKNTYVYLDKDPNYIPQKLECDYEDQIVGEIMEINKNISTEYWREELADYNRYVFYPTGDKHTFVTEILDLDLQLKKDLESLAASINTSLKHLCFAAYTYTLSKFSYEHDFVVGIITNTRPLVPDGERLLGCFLNAVPFRVDTSKAGTWREFINYMENKLIKMKRHEKIPLQKILEIIEEPAIDGNPLFDTSFNFVDFWVTEDILKYDSELEFDHHTSKDMDFATDNLDVNQNTLFDFHIWSDMYGMQMILEYSTEVLTAADIEKFHTYFKEILYKFVENVDELASTHPIITSQEKVQLLETYNDTQVTIKEEATLVSLLREQAQIQPETIAVQYTGGEITYKDLDEISNKVATYLQEVEGIKKGDLVGLMLEREASLMPVLYGILKAGGAYVPIDPKHPKNRINLIVKESKIKALITRGSYESINISNFDTHVIDLDVKQNDIEKQTINITTNLVTAEDLAYVIFTSGSTGKPKGVMLQHNNVVNFIEGVTKEIPFSEDSTILCLTTISFDIFGLESLLPISKGLKMVLANEEEQFDATLLGKAIQNHGVNMLQMTPSRVELLLSESNSNAILDEVRCIMIGGEAFPEILLDKVKKVYSGAIYNMYGPTETTIWSTIKELTNETSITIGKPIANTEIFILSKNNELLSDGVAGELCIGGKGLARGYFNNDSLTSSRFVQHPFKSNERLYKTGDLARWNNNGDLEFLGRIDNQVKIRGFRIELGEIETQLNQHEFIEQAVVLARETNGEKFLVAFYVSDKEIAVETLRKQLSRELPEYMIPSYYMHLEKLPLSPSGKIDRRALPDHTLFDTESYVAPSNEVEKRLTEIWSEVLKINPEEISIDKSFFDLGGHSLRAMILINKINNEYQKSFPLTLLFRYTTIADIAEYIMAAIAAEKPVEYIEDSEEYSF
ncbi:non-ribosomal peptide synthetase [Tenacibaculum agarivorans]|uniref:non-ribosomal peptide synthetase n=1 Tax=Tenacibaculum agarivorans TaxID=1908389 RepID=UPI00094B91BE|nr:non-ribosomal peptide synthetase [Tenacibaculum agarivorans]